MSTNFTKGLSVYGVPILPTVGKEVTTGTVYFVDSGNVDGADESATSGKTKDRPFVTIDYAINQCTANNGDIIYVMPGHTETISSLSSIVPDVAGISIIGLGNGDDRPEVIYATGSGNSSGRVSSLVISGAGTRISNIIFDCGTTDDSVKPLYGMRIQAPNVQIDSCTFRNSGCCSFFGGTNDGTLFIGGSSGGGIVFLGSTFGQSAKAWSSINNVRIINNEFLSSVEVSGSSSGCNIGVNLGMSGSSAQFGKTGSSSGKDSANIDISFNKFIGSFSYAAIAGSSSSVNHSGLQITNNYIYNTNLTAKTGSGAGSSGNFGIDINNIKQTGIIADNFIASKGSSNVFYLIDASEMQCFENYGATGSSGGRGVLIPVITTTATS